MTAAEIERLARDARQALLAYARRRARTREDAEDAVQEALAIAFAVRARIRPATATAYVGVTARNEANRLAKRWDRQRSIDQPLAGTESASAHEAIADRRRPDHDAVIDALDGLQRLKPDEARALIARALGWRYREICDAFDWSYTKTNRCLVEGRAAMRQAAAATPDH